MFSFYCWYLVIYFIMMERIPQVISIFFFFSKRAAHLDDDDADDDAAVRRACAQLTAGPSVAMTTRSAAPSVHINRHATVRSPFFIFIVNIPPAALLFSLSIYIYIY